MPPYLLHALRSQVSGGRPWVAGVERRAGRGGERRRLHPVRIRSSFVAGSKTCSMQTGIRPRRRHRRGARRVPGAGGGGLAVAREHRRRGDAAPVPRARRPPEPRPSARPRAGFRAADRALERHPALRPTRREGPHRPRPARGQPSRAAAAGDRRRAPGSSGAVSRRRRDELRKVVVSAMAAEGPRGARAGAGGVQPGRRRGPRGRMVPRMGLKDALPTSMSDALGLRAQRTLLLAALTGALTGIGVAAFEWITRSQIFDRILHQDIWVQAIAIVVGLALAAAALWYVGPQGHPLDRGRVHQELPRPGPAPVDAPGRQPTARRHAATLGAGRIARLRGPVAVPRRRGRYLHPATLATVVHPRRQQGADGGRRRGRRRGHLQGAGDRRHLRPRGPLPRRHRPPHAAARAARRRHRLPRVRHPHRHRTALRRRRFPAVRPQGARRRRAPRVWCAASAPGPTPR